MGGATTCLLLLFASGSVIAAAPSRPCPGPESTSSSGDLLPDDDNCSVYYRCASGEPVPQICPDDLHFNPLSQACESPSSAGCLAPTPPPPSTTDAGSESRTEITMGPSTDSLLEESTGELTTHGVTDELPETTITYGSENASGSDDSGTEDPSDPPTIPVTTNPATEISPSVTESTPKTSQVSQETNSPSILTTEPPAEISPSATESTLKTTQVSQGTNSPSVLTTEAQTEPASQSTTQAYDKSTLTATASSRNPPRVHGQIHIGVIEEIFRNSLINRPPHSDIVEKAIAYIKQNARGNSYIPVWQFKNVIAGLAKSLANQTRDLNAGAKQTIHSWINELVDSIRAVVGKYKTTNKIQTEPVSQSTTQAYDNSTFAVSTPQDPLKHYGKVHIDVIEEILRNSLINRPPYSDIVDKAIAYIKQNARGNSYIPEWQFKKLIAGLAKSLANQTRDLNPGAKQTIHSWINELVDSIRAVVVKYKTTNKTQTEPVSQSTTQAYDNSTFVVSTPQHPLKHYGKVHIDVIEEILRNSQLNRSAHNDILEKAISYIKQNAQGNPNVPIWQIKKLIVGLAKSLANQTRELNPDAKQNVHSLVKELTNSIHAAAAKFNSANKTQSTFAEPTSSENSHHPRKISINVIEEILRNSSINRFAHSDIVEKAVSYIKENVHGNPNISKWQFKRIVAGLAKSLANHTRDLSPDAKKSIHLWVKQIADSIRAKLSDVNKTIDSLEEHRSRVKEYKNNLTKKYEKIITKPLGFRTTTPRIHRHDRHQFKAPGKSNSDQSSKSELSEESDDLSSKSELSGESNDSSSKSELSKDSDDLSSTSEESKESDSDSSEEIAPKRFNRTTTINPLAITGVRRHPRPQFKLPGVPKTSQSSQSEVSKESLPASSEEIQLNRLKSAKTTNKILEKSLRKYNKASAKITKHYKHPSKESSEVSGESDE